MTTERNKQVVIKFNNEFFAKGNTEITKELLANSFVNHTAPPGAPTDASVMIQFITAFHKRFSDISIEIFEVLGEDNKVALRKTITGTHTGEFMGKQATGKKIVINIIDIEVLKDGKITERWNSTDFPQVFDGAISRDAVYNSWTPTHTNAKVPRLERTANFSNTTQYNSYYLENGSFLRCKSMVLGYSIPSGLTRKYGVDRFRVYIQAANLFTITKYTGLDPELTGSDLKDNSNFGIDFGNYPANQKNFLVGINLSF